MTERWQRGGISLSPQDLVEALLRGRSEAVVVSARESGRILEVSDSFCALSGYDRAEVVGRTLVALGAPADLAGASALQRRDGAQRWVEWSHELVGDDAVVVVAHDVTERGELERQLRDQVEIAEAALQAVRAADDRVHVAALLAELASGFSGATTSDEVATFVPGLLRDVLRSKMALVSFVDPVSRVLRSPHQGEGIADTALSGYATLPLDAPLAPRAIAARTGEMILAPDIGDYRELFPDGVAQLERSGIAAGAFVPFRDSSGVVVGVLAVGWERVTPFDDTLLTLLHTVANLCGQTVERTRLFESQQALVAALAEGEAREREVAETLQRALLPAGVPTVAQLELATRYRPGVQGTKVGGDWYDVARLARGRVGLCVGDVVGHGIGAAATMGQLRSAVSALAHQDLDPATLLECLDAFAHGIDAARFATVAYCVLDPASGRLDHACAAHPPPLVVPSAGPAHFLTGGRSRPLAVEPHLRRWSGDDVLEIGSTLVLYSDGLVERRGESITAGLDRLVGLVEAHRELAPDALAETLVGELLDNSGDGHDDDAVVLVARRRPGA